MLQIKNTYTDSAAGSGLEKKSSLAIIHKRVVYYTHGVYGTHALSPFHMSIIISGSLVYDRLLAFDGYFRDAIRPDEIPILSAFLPIHEINELYAGTAGNIAYNVKLLGDNPHIIAAAGIDFGRYHNRLKALGINTDTIVIFEKEMTASSVTIVDREHNQVVAFSAGAARCGIDVDIPPDVSADDSIVVIAASAPEEMVKRYTECIHRGLPYLFAPRYVMAKLTRDELYYGYQHSLVSIFNPYDWQLFEKKTGKRVPNLLNGTGAVVITRGNAGSTIYTRTGDYFIPIAQRNKTNKPFGAGDAYVAGLASALVRGWDWQTCGQVASTIASFVMESHGTQDHMFTMDLFNRRYRVSYNAKSPFEDT